MATTEPSTPEPSSARRAVMNRSFTVPSKSEISTTTEPKVEIGASKDVETLFTVPKANIVKFTTKPIQSRASSSYGSASDAPKLPWASSTEATVAAGQLRFYRVPGSTSFLHSGTLLHAILPRSQCWCVDGVSKFAMRVLPDTFYRIELPGETEDDLQLVEGMKECLKKVLLYEKTPCPFTRTFTVDLPQELEDGSARRRSKRRSDGPAKRWKLDKAYSWKPEGWTPEDGPWPPKRRGSTDSSAQNSPSGSDEETDSSRERKLIKDVEAEDRAELSDQVKELSFNTPTRPKALSAATRSVTAPPQLTLRSTPPSRVRVIERANGTIEATGFDRPTPNRLEPGRLRTFQAIPTDMPPSPPDSRNGLETLDNATDQSVPPAPELETTNVEADPVEEHTQLDNEQADSADVVADDATETHSTITAVPVKQSTERPRTPTDVENPQSHNTEEIAPSIQQPDEISSPSPPPEEVIQPRTPSPRACSALQELIDAAAAAPQQSRDSSPKPEDPYAAIQARIRARRTLSTKISSSSLTRKASSNSSSSASSTVSTRGGSRSLPRDRNMAAAMVARAYSAFLGPPAQLVAIMLRIANRLTHGALGAIFVESPAGFGRRVPGSFFLSEEEGGQVAVEDDGDAIDPEWEEDMMDDFGVPLRSPVRLAVRRRQERAEQPREEGAMASGRTSLSID